MSPKTVAAVLLGALLALMFVGVNASTITDNGDGTKTYYEGFETEPVNQPPDEAWYDFDDAGTPGAGIVTTSSPNTGARSLLVQVGSAAYMAGIENTVTDADLCEGPNQALAFNFKFPDWGNNAAVLVAGRISDSFGVTNSPFNNIDFRVTRSGVVTPSFALTAHIRGQSAAEVSQAVGTVAVNTVYTVTVSNMQCTGGPASATYTVVGGALNAGPNTLTATDAFTSTAIELDALSIGSTSATAAQGAYRLDEITYFSVPVEDADGDGVEDADDNCPTDVNPAQEDEDADGIGDVCEVDSDGDGVIDDEDNCPALSNADQQDLDANGVGDECQDGVLNTVTYIEDFEDDVRGDTTDEEWYDVATVGGTGTYTATTRRHHGGLQSGIPHDGSTVPGTEYAPNQPTNAGWAWQLNGFTICDATEVSFWFNMENVGTGGLSYIGAQSAFTSTAGSGTRPSFQFDQSVSASLGALSGTLPDVGGGQQEDWTDNGGTNPVVTPSVLGENPGTAGVWYQAIVNNIDCGNGAYHITVPALNVDLDLATTTGAPFTLGYFNPGGWCSGTGSTCPRWFIDDVSITVEGLAFSDSVLVPDLIGFDVDDLGKNAVFTRALSGADPLFSHMQTFQPYSSPNDPSGALPEIASDDDECFISDGVSIISSGSDPLHDESWDAAISWWGCPPGNEDNVNDLFINDVGFDTYAPDCDFCDEEIQDAQQDVNIPDDGDELADVRGYPYTFTQKYGSANCPGPDFGDDCNSVLTLWAFSERTTGKIGVYAHSHNNDADDSGTTEKIQYTLEGLTPDQICTWVGADGYDWLAAADFYALPKGYRIIVDDPGGSTTGLFGTDSATSPSITIIEEVSGPQKAFGATGIGCAGWLVAYTVPSEEEFESVQFMCTMTVIETSRHSGCNEGQIVAEVPVAGELANERGITLVQRGDYVDRDVYFGAYVEDDHIQYFSFEQGVLYLTCTSPLPPGLFYQMEMDQGGQSLWVAMTGVGNAGIYRYDVAPCTTIVDAPYNPPNDIGCHACDADGDGFQDGEDPQPNNEDCNDNGINDGEESAITCTNSHGETVTCTSTGNCEISDGVDTTGEVVDFTAGSGCAFMRGLGLDLGVPTLVVSILFGIATIAALAYFIGGRLMGGTRAGYITAILAGDVISIYLWCFPIWPTILVALAALAWTLRRFLGGKEPTAEPDIASSDEGE